MNSDRRDWKLAVIFGIILCGLVFASIFIQPYKSGAEYRLLKDYSEEDGTVMIPLKVNDFELTLDTHAPETAYDVGWLTTEQDTVISIGEFHAERVWINDREIKSGETISLRLESLNSQENIVVKIQDNRTDWVRQLYIRTLPLDFPDIEAAYYTISEDMDNEYCFALDNFLVKMDSRGNIVYYRVSNGATQFRQHYSQEKGCVRYSFLELTNQDPLTLMPSYKAVVMDENYNVIDIVSGLQKSGQPDTSIPLAQNGFCYIEDEHYLIAANNPTIVYNIPDGIPHEPMGTHVIASIVQEIENGASIWEWNSVHCPELYLESDQDYLDFTKSYIDYAHLSGLSYTMDGTVLIAFEHLNAVISILSKGKEWEISAKIKGNMDISHTEDGNVIIYSSSSVLDQSNWDHKLFTSVINVSEVLYQPYNSATYDATSKLLGVAWKSGEGSQLFTVYDLEKKKIVMELENCTSGTNQSLCVEHIFIS